MTTSSLPNTVERICNIIELVGVVLMLLIAFAIQAIFHEQPCPLCLLQRIGFFGVALGFLMNLRFGLRPSHYSMILISAIFTSFVALRQIALHVMPDTGEYGAAILGFHLYTWSYIISMIVLVITTLMLAVDRQYQRVPLLKARFHYMTYLLFAILVILIGLNLISVLFECGFRACPENLTQYLFNSIGV